jgi:RNA recognition motif-containing protein
MTGQLFVSHLDPRATESTLLQLFRPFGTVTEWKYFWNKDVSDASFGTPRGIALVTMATPDEAQRARLALNGRLVGSQQISVRSSVQRVEIPQNAVVAPVQLSDNARRNHISMLRSKLNAMRGGTAAGAQVGVSSGDAAATEAAATTTTTAESTGEVSTSATKRKRDDDDDNNNNTIDNNKNTDNNDNSSNNKEKRAATDQRQDDGGSI